jgi:hypothetical protein
LIDAVIRALTAITNARFFETERGFQGAFQANLVAALGDRVPPEAIVEEEYQKRIKIHGIRRRPDVIVHTPTQAGGDFRAGNFAVFALKLRANPSDARQDFEALDAMFAALHYPLGAFINIGDDRTHAEQYGGAFHDRVHTFAVWQSNGLTHVRHGWHNDGQLLHEDAL